VRSVRLSGEIALVTGSTAGIGRAIAVEFAAQGAGVVVTGRNRARGEAVVAAAGKTGGEAAFVGADLSDEEACDGLVRAALDRFGRLTVLVNSAAGGEEPDGAIADLDTFAWESILRVNLSAPMWLCRASIPAMIAAGRGSIVNISSRQGKRASPGHTGYIVSKGGLEALTRAIAVDYARHNIRCNTISPGYVLNERRDAGLSDERRARLEGMHLTRLGQAADVAYAAVYLASRESEFVTGIDLPLDGGSSIARGLTLG
jgi:NAD(P)-dependent dehydrogenase (short-subunit alcohol dehydrogenase family)